MAPENTSKIQANSFSCIHIVTEFKEFEEYLHLRGHKLQLPSFTKNATHALDTGSKSLGTQAVFESLLQPGLN